MELCKSCDDLDFSIVGLHGADFRDADMFGNEGQLSDVFANEDVCFLCHKMGSFFKDWANKVYGGMQNLNLDNARVNIDAYRLRSLDGEDDRGDDQEDDGDGEGHDEESDSAHLVRVRISYLVRKPGSERTWVGPEMYFQKCDPRPMTVAELCNGASNLEWPKQEPYTGRIRPLVADTRLFR